MEGVNNNQCLSMKSVWESLLELSHFLGVMSFPIHPHPCNGTLYDQDSVRCGGLPETSGSCPPPPTTERPSFLLGLDFLQY